MRYLSLVLALVVFTGCTTRMVDFTAISTKSLSFEGERGERVRGEEVQHILFIFPLDIQTPTMKGAIDKALENGKCDLLMDGVVYIKNGGFPLIYMENGFVVEGTCVNIK